jgi:hypothetical protein
MGASAPPAAPTEGRRSCSERCPKPSRPGRQDGDRRQDGRRPSARPRSSSSRAPPRRWPRPSGRQRFSRGAAACRALVRRVQLPPSRIRRSRSPGPPQGAGRLTVSLVLPTLNEAETIGASSPRRRDLMERHPLRRRAARDGLRLGRRTTREIAEAEGARVAIHSAGPPRRTAATAARARRCGRACTRPAATSSSGRCGRPQLASAHGLRDPGPADRRGADPVRQGLLPAADRRRWRPQGRRRRRVTELVARP